MSFRKAALGGVSLAALLVAPATLSAVTIKSVEFMGMEAPKTAVDMARIYSAAQAKVTYSDGSEKIFPLRFDVLYRNVDRIGSNPYERVVCTMHSAKAWWIRSASRSSAKIRTARPFSRSPASRARRTATRRPITLSNGKTTGFSATAA